ncbi:reverse transcriptase domain-containing protein [Tanacetum coccineum]
MQMLKLKLESEEDSTMAIGIDTIFIEEKSLSIPEQTANRYLKFRKVAIPLRPHVDFSHLLFALTFGGSDFLMEEIDEFLEHDDSIPPGVDGIYDSEGDTVTLENFKSRLTHLIRENDLHPALMGLCYHRMPLVIMHRSRSQRCNVAIFHDMIEKTMEVFMDDFSVFSDSFSSWLSHLDKMLQRCEDINLVLNWEKCHFMVQRWKSPWP